ncbi:hypothetical protein MKW92_005668, partial [Papaver armeniacum]
SEFKFNAPSHLVRPNLEVTFSQKFRTFKYQLRQNYFKIARGKAQIEAVIQAGLDPNAWKSKEEILANVPMGVTPSNWTAFVENEFKEGVEESHEKKSENKKKCTIPHTLGRRTYANKCYLLAEEDGMVTEDREYAWMKGHEKRDGTVHPSAVKKYVEQVKAVYEKRKEEGTNCSYDFGSDGLVDVFGPNKGKRSLRGFSSSVSAKRAKQAFLTAALRDSTVTKCNSPVIGLKKNLDPMSEPQPFDNSGYEESSYQNVNLLDRNGKIVANENKVRIECVYDDSAPIWDPPQGDDFYKLSSYVAGGWIIWHKKRLQFTN